MPTLIMLRHGESEWNAANRFTGWYNCNLTPTGEQEARTAGLQLVERDMIPDIIHTSIQARAIRTTYLVLETLGRPNIPVRRDWRLNERHYGNLTGLDKAETRERYGKAQFQAWRRGYTTTPPPISVDNPYNPKDDPCYAKIPEGAMPLTECLADVMIRLLPYWEKAITPDLAANQVVLISAHGNSLRALCKHLDRIDDDAVTGLNIPTGIPLVYELDDNLRPIEERPVLQRALNQETAQTAIEDVTEATD